MRNPLRTEAEAFRFLVIAIVGAAVIVVCAYIDTWLGVAAAIAVVGGVATWIWRAPPAVPPGAPRRLVPPSPPGRHRILLLAPPDASTAGLGERVAERADGREAEVLVVVPALAATVEAFTGAVDERRDEAQRTADALAARIARSGVEARGAVGADEPVLATEDALREFGADEVVIAGGDGELRASVQERVAVPVSLLR